MGNAAGLLRAIGRASYEVYLFQIPTCYLAMLLLSLLLGRLISRI